MFYTHSKTPGKLDSRSKQDMMAAEPRFINTKLEQN